MTRREGVTKRWPSFAENEPFLASLRDYLTSQHGRSRTEKESRQISMEVGRFLHFAQPQSLQELLLIDVACLDRYLRVLEENNVPSSTLVAKLSRLRVAIDFLSPSLEPEQLCHVKKVKGVLKNWRSVLGRDVRLANRERLEEMSENPVTLEGSHAFLSCQELKYLVSRLIAQPKKKQEVKSTELRSAVIWLAGSLLLGNHQRPGAVVNATLEEYQSAKLMTFGRWQYETFYVRQHKTGTTGRAKITANKQLFLHD